MTRSLCLFFMLSLIIPASLLPFNFAGAETNPLEMSTEDERLVRWDLSADSLISHNESNILEAKGNVYLRRGDEFMKADYARYYGSTKWVYLKGNVQVRMGRDTLTANEAEFDLRSRVGWLKQGKIFIEGPHTYITGDKIHKHWGDIYTFKDAKITTCDGDTPAWSITSDEAIVEVDGYARMKGSSFQVKDQPVAYTPFFLFPTKTSRQTGFLLPEYGKSSRKGFYYNQPFFWVINDSSDVTINENFMEKRGFMHGIQYRTRPYSDTTGWIRLDWLNDKQHGSTAWTGTNKNLHRNNAERYWVRGMLDTRLPDPNWRLKADLDYVSDQNYLNEFKGGMFGFRSTQSEVFSLFSREFQEKNKNRESGILLTRDWDRVSVALSSQYTQNPALGHGNTKLANDSTVQQLPQMNVYVHKGRILQDIPVEFQVASQAAYFYRRNGTSGSRYTLAPRVTVPITSDYGSILATGGVTQMFYATTHKSHSNPDTYNGPKEDNDSKTVPDFSLAGSTEFARVYDLESTPLPLTNATVGKSQWTAVKHSVEPRLEYRYRPLVDQDDNPYYDEDDRLTPTTDLVYSLTTSITRKKESVVMSKDKDGKMTPTANTSYQELVRLRVEQAYDYREATRTSERDKYERRPFGDVFSELSISLSPYVSVSTKNNWSPYKEELTRHQSGVTVNMPDWGRIYAGYDLRAKLDEYTRQRTNRVRNLRLDGDIDLWGPFTFRGGFKYDMEDYSNREYYLELTYNHQCFTLIGRCLVEPQEESYQLMFMLSGLGD